MVPSKNQAQNKLSNTTLDFASLGAQFRDTGGGTAQQPTWHGGCLVPWWPTHRPGLAACVDPGGSVEQGWSLNCSQLGAASASCSALWAWVRSSANTDQAAHFEGSL